MTQEYTHISPRRHALDIWLAGLLERRISKYQARMG